MIQMVNVGQIVDKDFICLNLMYKTGISTELNLTPAEELAAMEARVWAGLTWNADQSGRTQAGLKNISWWKCWS